MAERFEMSSEGGDAIAATDVIVTFHQRGDAHGVLRDRGLRSLRLALARRHASAKRRRRAPNENYYCRRRSFIAWRISLAASAFFFTSRLSYCFFPRATAISILA